MPEKSWLIVWDQLGKASIHSGWSLKFIKTALISESEINTLHACLHTVGALLAPSLPPTTHNVNVTLPLQLIQQVASTCCSTSQFGRILNWFYQMKTSAASFARSATGFGSRPRTCSVICYDCTSESSCRDSTTSHRRGVVHSSFWINGC